jgi:hypothetical protein
MSGDKRRGYGRSDDKRRRWSGATLPPRSRDGENMSGEGENT